MKTIQFPTIKNIIDALEVIYPGCQLGYNQTKCVFTGIELIPHITEDHCAMIYDEIPFEIPYFRAYQTWEEVEREYKQWTLDKIEEDAPIPVGADFDIDDDLPW